MAEGPRVPFLSAAAPVAPAQEAPGHIQQPHNESVEVHQVLDIATLSSRKPSLVAALLAVSYLGIGVVCFHSILDLTWASAFYFAVTTSLTVGYGDIDAWNPMSVNSTTANDGHPYIPNDGAIIFSIFFILGGVLVVGTAFGMILESFLESSSEDSLRSRYPLTLSATLCTVTTLIGAAIHAAIHDIDFLHGLYWAVVTVCTVGYGSGGPDDDASRLFATLFMLIGVSTMGNFLGELSARPLRAHRARLEERVLSQYGNTLEASELAELVSSEQARALDLRNADAGGGVTRDAFCLLMLVRTDKISGADLRRCQKAFDQLDADGSGTLDMEDVRLSETLSSSGRLAPESTSSTRGGEPHRTL